MTDKKCAIDHSSQKQFATSFFVQTLIESSSFSAFDCKNALSIIQISILFLSNIDGKLKDADGETV